MKKVLTYIRNNKMFIILLSVILAITLGLTFYYLTEIREPKQILHPTKGPEIEENTDTTLSSFQTSYDAKTKQIHLHWSWHQGDQKITSIKLYNENNILADVTTLNSYVLNQDVYQFPGGNNVFVLKVSLDSGEVLEKKANVNIDYFSTIDCKTEISDIGVLVMLSYQYNTSINIGIPRIVANSLPYEYDFIYRETKKEELENGNIKETTIFEVNTSKAKTDEKVTIRWIFDMINTSYDFPITLPSASKK